MTTILITRPERQSNSLKTALETLGARVLLQPTIAIEPPDDWNELDTAIRCLTPGGRSAPTEIGFDWIVFSSANGVESFYDRSRLLQVEWDPSVKIAAVGPGTDEVLRHVAGRSANLVPAEFTAEGLVSALSSEAVRKKRFLLVRGNRGRDVLNHQLTILGGRVVQATAYRSFDLSVPKPEVREALRAGQIDWTTATSSSIARSLVVLFGDELRKTRLVSISPITSAVLRELGFPPQLEAARADMAGIFSVLSAQFH